MNRLTASPTELAALLRAVDRADRAECIRYALSLGQHPVNDAFVVAVRDALARRWKTVFAEPLPTTEVTAEFQPPLPLALLSQLSLLNIDSDDKATMATVIDSLFRQLHRKFVFSKPK